MAATTKGDQIQDMSEVLQTICLSNLDEAPARRRAREAIKDIQLAIDHCLFRVMCLIFLFFAYPICLNPEKRNIYIVTVCFRCPFCAFLPTPLIPFKGKRTCDLIFAVKDNELQL